MIDKMLQSILDIPSESRTIEFKRLSTNKDGIIKTVQSIVAMANTDGGYIILGIGDPEKSKEKGIDRIFGIEENLDLYDALSVELKKITPPIPGLFPPNLHHVKEKNVRIGIMDIPKVSDSFRSYEGHVFIRLERSNRRLSPQEIIQLAYIKGFQRADNELVDIDINLLDTIYYKQWKENRKITENNLEKVLLNTGLARSQKNIILPTRAAVLLFAEYPNDLMDTKCTIRVFQYIGKEEKINETLNIIGVPQTIDGPISSLIQKSHEYVLQLLRSGIKVPSGFTTQYNVPERAVKEALTNAVIHRDYYTKRDIEVKIFEDRIEIESPGLLPFNITPSNIGIVRATGYRNDLLVKHLREFPNPPNLDQNEGVKAMRNSMKEASKYPPIFTTYPDVQDGLRVILLNESAPNAWDKISHYLSVHKYISNVEARKLLFINDTVYISKQLQKWVEMRLLTKIVLSEKAKKGTKYRLPTQEERILFSNDKENKTIIRTLPEETK